MVDSPERTVRRLRPASARRTSCYRGYAMKVGVTLFAQNYTDWDRFEASERGEGAGAASIPDAQIYQEELHIGRLVEPLGFDSIWAVEHHFTPYTMVPDVLQMLTYFAGCTERIDMGTMVIVLPWHDPLRVVEGISMLDNMLAGRELTVGLGRGAGRREFEGLRIPMGESRDRFLESVEILRKGLSQERFSHQGTYYDIPETSLRPRPRSTDLADRLYCAWGSPATIPIAAAAGLKPLFIPQKAWEDYRDELGQYSAIRAEHGWEPVRPIVVCWVYCAPTEEEAWEGARRYMPEYADSAKRHYELLGDHFASTKGYEFYAEMSKMIKEAEIDPLGEMYITNQVWGTPEQCVEKLRRINDAMAPSEFVAVMKYGAMPVEAAEASMRLFAERVLPTAQQMEHAPIAAPSGAGQA